jgi:hypothetical protein
MTLGWSAGDLMTSINILYAIANAFKTVSSAESQFTETASWLESFASDLALLNEYTIDYSKAQYTKNILDQVGRINTHYAEFETYLQKYDKDLSSTARASTITDCVKRVKWAFKELNRKVHSLKFAVNGPMISIKMLLALQS